MCFFKQFDRIETKRNLGLFFFKKKVAIIEKKKASVSFSRNTIDRGSSVFVFFLFIKKDIDKIGLE